MQINRNTRVRTWFEIHNELCRSLFFRRFLFVLVLCWGDLELRTLVVRVADILWFWDTILWLRSLFFASEVHPIWFRSF